MSAGWLQGRRTFLQNLLFRSSQLITINEVKQSPTLSHGRLLRHWLHTKLSLRSLQWRWRRLLRHALHTSQLYFLQCQPWKTCITMCFKWRESDKQNCINFFSATVISNGIKAFVLLLVLRKERRAISRWSNWFESYYNGCHPSSLEYYCSLSSGLSTTFK